MTPGTGPAGTNAAGHAADARRGHAAPLGLVALGSLAVIAVYSAGFYRTREAAARFAEEAVPRRRPASPAEAVPLAPAPKVATNTKRPAPAAKSAAASPARAPDAATAPIAPPAATTTSPDTTGSIQLADAKIPKLPLASVESTVVAAPPKPAEPAVTTPTPVPAPVQPAPAEAVPPAALRWKDGTYAGWGTSRHGDIEATVTITDGKITAARISLCMTQYSCSWIAHLPAQVLRRQSPDVDYVSGATQSTNAFYYAVVDALKRAK